MGHLKPTRCVCSCATSLCPRERARGPRGSVGTGDLKQVCVRRQDINASAINEVFTGGQVVLSCPHWSDLKVCGRPASPLSSPVPPCASISTHTHTHTHRRSAQSGTTPTWKKHGVRRTPLLGAAGRFSAGASPLLGFLDNKCRLPAKRQTQGIEQQHSASHYR